jgi:uridine phosphorylase
VPTRLRPTAPIAADAILVGDPGRALLLAQELLLEPKMSNHARGLWGYFGTTSTGHPLTIQSTGMGGPSAGLVLGELAELGARRAVRVGTCVGLDASVGLGELVVVSEAVARGGSATSFGLAVGESVEPDSELAEALATALAGQASKHRIASFDAGPDGREHDARVAAGDMQTAPLLARARSLGLRVAALLIVAEVAGGGTLDKDDLEQAERRAGRAARVVLSI